MRKRLSYKLLSAVALLFAAVAAIAVVPQSVVTLYQPELPEKLKK